MPTYISLMTYTDEGLRNVKKSPSRLDAARKVAKELGGKIGDVYLTMRSSDRTFSTPSAKSRHPDARN